MQPFYNQAGKFDEKENYSENGCANVLQISSIERHFQSSLHQLVTFHKFFVFMLDA